MTKNPTKVSNKLNTTIHEIAKKIINQDKKQIKKNKKQINNNLGI